MNADERFAMFVRSRMLPVDASVSPIHRDLWPLILGRRQRGSAWPRTDVALAAAVAIILVMRPDLFFLVVFYF